MHTRNREFNETVEVGCEFPAGLDLSKFLLYNAIERRRRDELDVRCKYHRQINVSVGSAYERILKDAVLLEDGHGKSEVLLNHPLDQCLMGDFRLASVGDGVFQGLASLLRSDFSHLGDLVVNSL